MQLRRRALKICLAIVLGLLAWYFVPTRETLAFRQSRARMQAAQPEGLSMELKLPKTRFYQGEIIPATLVFRNASPDPYFAWNSAFDRSHNPDIRFCAVDRKGHAVSDPLKLYYERCGSLGGGGPGGSTSLGEWEFKLTANEWLRFDQPGVYRLYASSKRVARGSSGDELREEGPPLIPVTLVSQIVTIRIDPLLPAQEQTILEQIRKDLAGNHDYDVSERLQHLQTPAARDLMRSLLEDPKAYNAGHALLSVPDPGAEAASILQAVRAGKQPIGYETLNLYPNLKRMAAPAQIPRSYPDPLLTELLDAARATLHGDFHREIVSKNLVGLFRHDPSDPATRSLVVDHQLELNKAVTDLLLYSLRFDPPPDWKTNKKRRAAQVPIDQKARDFLPLVRRSASAPHHNRIALTILARLQPEEARQLIVDDIQHPPFKFRGEGSDDRYALVELCSLRGETLLPELNETFHTRLNPALGRDLGRDEGFDATMMLVECYGTPALLPDVLRAYQGGRCDSQHPNALRYILRCDGEVGRELLRQALKVRLPNGSQRLLADVLERSWQPEALPLVLDALDNPDEEIWTSAVEVIAAHAASPNLSEKMIATAARVSTKPVPAGRYGPGVTALRQDRLVEFLLKDDAWQLTREQLLRLKALPNSRKYTRMMLDNRLANAEMR